MSVINLYEYQNKEELLKSSKSLEIFLDDVWNNREKSGYYFNQEESKIEVQQFLQFLHKTGEIKSNKYVGVIHFEGQKINLLPKIFYDKEKPVSDSDLLGIQNHILWWLSYCRKIKFPNYQTALDTTQSDFFEVLIYLFSKYTRELMSSTIYQQYEEVSRELNFIKGRLDTSTYINENLSKGRWHKLSCQFDAFELDNKFNRIVKQVATMLFNHTTSPDNKKNLREILFILDEVSDTQSTAEECEKIEFNPFFSDFETVRDYCTLFLRNSVSFNYKNDLKLFAFLLPMEYVFEDFIFGFIEKELPDVSARAQATSTYLDREGKYGLKPDLILETPHRKLIADTKYKIVYADKNDPKHGISQNDLYQMLAYAVRFKIDEILIFYPDNFRFDQISQSEIHIKDEFALDIEVKIKTFQLPIINREIFHNNLQSRKLSEIFLSTKIILSKRLAEILLLSR